MKWNNTRPAVCKGTAVLACMLALSGLALPAAAGAAAGTSAVKTTSQTVTAPDTAAGQTAAAAATKTPATTPTQAQTPAPAIAAPQGPIGYTEAEIQDQLNKQYQQKLPEYRTVSGGQADTGYTPGSLDVKIPAFFFPDVIAKPVTGTYRLNADGTYGMRPEYAQKLKAYEAEKAALAQQAAAAAAEGQDKAVVEKAQGAAKAPAPAVRYKTVTGWVNVPAPSPFHAFATGDFNYISNSEGGYNVPVVWACRTDPLQGLPQSGPMMLRSASEAAFVAATVDDPDDTYHYKNSDTFPKIPNVKPVFTETRKSREGYDTAITYFRYYVSGTECFAVDSSMKAGRKTYRLFQLFPENGFYSYLPKALYAVENMHTIATVRRSPQQTRRSGDSLWSSSWLKERQKKREAAQTE